MVNTSAKRSACPDALSDIFVDLHAPLNKHQAMVEADRCFFCYDAPCMTACPTSIDVPLFIRQIMSDNAIGAAETILDANVMGGMCARVCPTETLCEEACVRNTSEDKPVVIGQLQRYAVDALMDAGHQPFNRAAPTGKKIAVVGGGPAGLSCAHRLAMHGHEVTVFEARPKLAGLNEYGIAAYKATNGIAQREADFILSIGGIEAKCNIQLGRDVLLADLRRDYDAVFLGLGMNAVNHLGLNEDTLEGVYDAVDFIARLRQASTVSEVPIGRRVIVIGGGMTAVDAAIQSKKLGAEDVTMVYRRGQESMNASLYEQELAQINGVRIKHWAMPVRFMQQDGKVTGMEFEYTRQGAKGLEGTGERFVIEADMVFAAIGQKLDADMLALGAEVVALEKGRFKVDAQRRTSLTGVWAGGDCISEGEDLTVVSVEDGKLAAESIHATLTA
jgi:dihydropyrimidine dehydrogenase (NAD+) subunit PreT